MKLGLASFISILLLVTVISLVGPSVDGVEIELETDVPVWVLEDSLTLEGTCKGTDGQVVDDTFVDFEAGTVENVTVRSDGVVLSPDLEFSILNQGDPVLENGGPYGWDVTLRFGSTLKVGSKYYLYYSGGPRWQYCQIGLATSSDGVHFTKHPDNPILSPSTGESSYAKPYVYHDGSSFLMYYSVWDGVGFHVDYAKSTDGVHFTRPADNRILDHGSSTSWNYVNLVGDIFREGGVYRMYYYGYAQGGPMYLATATSTDLISWTQYSGNPIRRSDIDGWEEFRTTYGTAQFLGSDYRLWATSGDVYGDWYLGWMRSSDGVNFTRSDDAVLYPEEGTIYSNGVRDPYVFDMGDHYMMICLCYDSNMTATYGAFRIEKKDHWGTFTSRKIDVGGTVEVTDVSWTKVTQGGGTVDLFLRHSDDDLTWSDWTPVDALHKPVGTEARFFQYRASFWTPLEWYEQGLSMFSLSYSSHVIVIETRVDDGPSHNVTVMDGNWKMVIVLDDGDHNITITARDTLGGFASITIFVRVDLTPPTGGIIVERGGRYTGSRNLYYDVWAEDTHGVPYYIISTRDDFLGSDWIDFPPTGNGTIEFTGLDGPAMVFVRFKDPVGRESQVYFDDIIVDTTPPEGSLVIDGGAKYTVDVDVHLSIRFYDMTGVVGMKVSNEPSFAGVDWQDPVTSMEWSLDDEEGIRTVHVRLVDPVGWETDLADEIILDRTPPAASLAIDGDAPFATSRGVTLNITLWGGETVWVQLCNQRDLWSGEWERVTSTVERPWVLTEGPDGDRRVLMRVRDQAGNEIEVFDDIVLDTTPPGGRLEVEGGEYYTDHRMVDVLLEAHDATSGLDRMRVANAPSFEGSPWQNLVYSFVWDLGSGEGPRTVYVELRDRAGLTTMLRSSIVLDSVPPSGRVIVDGGAVYSPDSQVDVELELVDETSGIVDMMVSNDAGFTGATWETLRTSFQWTLSPGDGEKVVYVRVRDSSGLVGNLWGSTVLDTTPPVLSVEIDGGEVYATGRSVHVELSVGPDISGVREMSVSLSEDFAGAEWVPFRDVMDLDLAPEDGEQVVRVRVRDGAGHVTTATDSIVLDTTPPEGAVEINGGAGLTNYTTVLLVFTASDATSGVSMMRVSEQPEMGEMSWSPMLEALELVLVPGDGERWVYVEFMDAVGWVSEANASIVLDTTPPDIAFTSPEGNRVTSDRVSFTFTVEDAIDPSPLKEWRVDGGQWEEVATTDFVLTLKDGRHAIEVRATDAAGNSAVDTKEVTVDLPVELSTGRYLLIVVVIILVLLVATLYMTGRKRAEGPPGV